MNFQEELKGFLSKVDGAKVAVLMGLDGIPVAEAKADPASSATQDAVIECSRLLGETLKMAQGNDLGGLQELTMTTQHYRFVFRLINDAYFIGLVLSSDSNLGKGRFTLRAAAADIQSAL